VKGGIELVERWYCDRWRVVLWSVKGDIVVGGG